MDASDAMRPAMPASSTCATAFAAGAIRQSTQESWNDVVTP